MRDPSYFEYPTSRLSAFASTIGLTAVPAGVKLLDISENQSRAITSYFPNLVASGYNGIIIRATDGMLKDKSFEYFYPAALDAGMIVMIYAAMYASKSGKDQANFLLNTILPFLDAVQGKTVVFNDGETSDGVPIATHRTAMLDWLDTTSKVVEKVGAYGSIKTWQEFYGNLTLPAKYYFWNAQWRSGSTFTIPMGITMAQTVFWQNGVWPNYTWIPQPDGLPKAEDVDHNIMPNKTLQDLKNFTGQQVVTPPIPPPTPVPPHTHPDLLALIQAQDIKIGNLQSAVQQLTRSMMGMELVPAEVWKIVGAEAPARFAKSWNNAEIIKGGPRMQIQIYPGDGSDTSERIKLSGNVTIFPMQFVGDGNERYYPLLDQKWYDKVPAGIFLYVRAEDIEPTR
jgi:hypothetical protein